MIETTAMVSQRAQPTCEGRLVLTRRANQQNPVQPLSQKYSDFPKTQITLYPRPSRPTEGRLAIVTDAGRDAVDADVPLTNGA
jgi:hypothetical protein